MRQPTVADVIEMNIRPDCITIIGCRSTEPQTLNGRFYTIKGINLMSDTELASHVRQQVADLEELSKNRR